MHGLFGNQLTIKTKGNFYKNRFRFSTYYIQFLLMVFHDPK
jgi:hypothetical protein